MTESKATELIQKEHDETTVLRAPLLHCEYEPKTSHDLAVLALCSWCASWCLFVQVFILPQTTHWIVRGCVNHIVMIFSDKYGYKVTRQLLQPPKLIPRNRTLSARPSCKIIAWKDMLEHWLEGVLFRGATFGFMVDASQPELLTWKSIFVDVRSFSVTSIGISLLSTFARVFVWTMAFDFCYYSLHRVGHWRIFYESSHKKHHQIVFPSKRATLYMEMVEVFATAIACAFFAQQILPLKTHELILAYASIQIMEAMGHTGTDWRTNGFLWCPWLPRWLGIPLRVQDHDLHHCDLRFNMSSQFSLWDQVFGTYCDPYHLVSRTDNASSIRTSKVRCTS